VAEIISIDRGWVLKRLPALACLALLFSCPILAQVPVKLTIDTSVREFAIPPDFSGLGFETKSAVPNEYGVSGYFFTPQNTQLVTLFQNIGLKNIRVGGGTVDGSGTGERCVTPTPSEKDIDHLFAFAQAAGVSVIYSVRLLNVDTCKNPNLASEDAAIAKYVWNTYRPDVASLSIGNEPDVRQFHSYPGHPSDSAIVETVPGVAGSAYPSYLADWRKFADVILKSVPDAKFSGPDTAVSSTSSFTPDPTNGVSWTEKFASDLKDSGILVEALQHHYVWGSPGNTTAQEAIDDMLSPAWDNDESKGMQPAMNGGKAEFHPYPFVYKRVLSSLVPMGVPYRMTEANDCLHGVFGASDGYASALWALDYMHWWAAHRMAGMNFHNNPWIPTDTIVPNPNPCPRSGCVNFRIAAKGYGIKAFDVGGHGFVMPVAISNPSNVNLTAYAAGTDQDLYVTIINRTHSTTHDVTSVMVTIDTRSTRPATAAAMVLSGGEPGDAAAMDAKLGGAEITNRSRWLGKWTPLGIVKNGSINVTVQSTTAVIVKISAAGAFAGPVQADQNGDLHFFATGSGGKVFQVQQAKDKASARLAELPPGISFEQTSAIARNEDNTLEVFATGSNGVVYHQKQMRPDGSWSNWFPLGGDHISQVEAAQNADGSLSVFGIGSNGDLWFNSESAPGVGWTGWRDLGRKRIEPGYVVAQNLSGRLEVFGADDRGMVWHCAQNDSGGWDDWSSLGGKVASHLGVGKNLDGRLELFAIGADSRLKHIAQNSSGGEWGHWSTVSGPKIKPGFVVGQYADGRLAVFAPAIDNRPAGKTAPAISANLQPKSIWTVAQQSAGTSYGKWSSTGSAEGGQLAVGNDRTGHIELFSVDGQNRIWINRESATGLAGWTKVSGDVSVEPENARP
jgi:hypothetical protein